MSLIDIIIIKPSKIIKPPKLADPSNCWTLFLPINLSKKIKNILPPSKAGMGKTFIIPKFKDNIPENPKTDKNPW